MRRFSGGMYAAVHIASRFNEAEARTASDGDWAYSTASAPQPISVMVFKTTVIRRVSERTVPGCKVASPSRTSLVLKIGTNR